MRQKIIAPGLPTTTISRPRINKILGDLLEKHDAVAILAAAGSGKTVLAQTFAKEENWTISWLSLDDHDASATRMLEYLATSLSEHVPDMQKVLDRAFIDSQFIEEVAAVLAGNVTASKLLIVFDNCEKIANSIESNSALETFLDYLPIGVRALLLSREEIGFTIGRRLLDGHIGRLRDDDISLTMEEAANFANALGEDADQVEKRWNNSLGWIAGFVFGTGAQSEKLNQERDLRAYVITEVFERLSDEEQSFLMETSILNAVTQQSAVALCGSEARVLWRNLNKSHLPATISASRAIIYHPVFRDFLREELSLRSPDRLTELQIIHVDLLIESGQIEDAVELLISLKLLQKGVLTFETIAPLLVRRGDWETYLRWIDALEITVEDHPLLVGGYIKSLRGTRHLHRARAFIRALHSTDKLREILEVDPTLIAHIGWCMNTEPKEALDLLNGYDSKNYASDVRYFLDVTTTGSPVSAPLREKSADTDRLMSWGYLLQGRLKNLVAMLPNTDEWPPQSPYTTPHPLLGLLWRGEVSLARELLDQVPDEIRARNDTDIWYYIESWILLIEGDFEKSVEILELAISYSRNSGFGFEPVFLVLQGIGLIHLGKISNAITILENALDLAQSSGQVSYAEWAHAGLGHAFLLDHDAKKAAHHLRIAVAGMSNAQRLLMLPMAAIYLSEAEWELKNESASDSAALIAYQSSEQMGAFPPLQLALRQFPEVSRRQLARQPDINWKNFDYSDTKVVVPQLDERNTDVFLQTFGQNVDVHINGHELSIGRLKVIELMYYLLAHPKGASRLSVQLALFPETDRRKGSNHLRQVVYQLRKCTGLTLERRARDTISWNADIVARSADNEFESALRRAKDLVGQERLDKLTSALKLVNGVFIPGSNLEWVSVRRDELEVLTEEAEMEISVLAYKLGQFDIARQNCESLLARNPYLTVAYKILMMTEIAVDSQPSILSIYLRAKKAHEEIGLEIDEELTALMNKQKRKVRI